MSATVIAETLRRHFAHIGYIGALLLIMVIAAVMAWMGGPPSYTVFPLFFIVAGCQLIGPEFSSGTLQLILSKPIRRTDYLLSRVAGVIAALWIVVALTFVTDAVARLLAGHGAVSTADGGIAAAVAAQAVLVCSLMALFGSFTRSYLNVAIYLGGEIVLSILAAALQFVQRADRGALAGVGAFLRAHPAVNHAFLVVHDNVYPDLPPVPFDRNWLLLIFGNAAVALLLACLIFRKREVPYGAD